MSIEFVRAPEKGVTISLAGHNLFLHHKLVFTFDAIKVDSYAYNALVSAIDQEKERAQLSREKFSLREVLRLRRRRHVVGKSDHAQTLEDRVNEAVPDTFDISEAARKEIRDRLAHLKDYLQSFLAGRHKTEKTENV